MLVSLVLCGFPLPCGCNHVISKVDRFIPFLMPKVFDLGNDGSLFH